MKISYSDYPILQMLQNKSLGKLPTYQCDAMPLLKIMDRFVNDWKRNITSFQSQINVISKPFWQACNNARDPMIELYRHIAEDNVSDFDIAGTYIIEDRVFMIDYHIKKGIEDVEIALFIFSKKGVPLGYHSSSVKQNLNDLFWASATWEHSSKDELISWIYTQLVKIICITMFKSYAQVETTFLEPKQRTREILCKYRNDTNIALTFLDSKWFTNLVKSDSFSVRGHFRFQPYKNKGQWSKRIIWISEFQKTGYTAPAKKLQQSN